MPINESFLREEVVFVAGLNLGNAHERAASDRYVRETAQAAYNALDLYEAETGEYEVYEIRTTTRITKVDPPYSKRS